AEPWERRELAPLPPPDEPPPESVETNSPTAEPSASSVEPSAMTAQPVPTPDLPAGIKKFKTTFHVKIEGKTRIFPIKLYGDKLAARKAAVTFQQRVTRMLTRCEVMKGQARI
ncbi:unnamed protein product, partial [Cladocopium goreaui]